MTDPTTLVTELREHGSTYEGWECDGSTYEGWECDGSASICETRVGLIDRAAVALDSAESRVKELEARIEKALAYMEIWKSGGGVGFGEVLRILTDEKGQDDE